MTLYPRHSPVTLEPEYSRHVAAMTTEALHHKSDIAAQLAWRDRRIVELEALLAERTKRTTSDELSRLRELEAKATPGPWTSDADEPASIASDCAAVWANHDIYDTIDVCGAGECWCHDARFIAAARNAIPALLDAEARAMALHEWCEKLDAQLTVFSLANGNAVKQIADLEAQLTERTAESGAAIRADERAKTLLECEFVARRQNICGLEAWSKCALKIADDIS